MTYLLTQTVYSLKILLYTGQDDLLVTYPGVLNYVKNLKWSGISLFISSPNYILQDTDNNTIGTFQHYGKLSLVLANKAGHSVPQDQPWTAWEIVQRFVEDNWVAEEMESIGE
jgi:carboxypeptidase C (cathepsin A)